MILCILRGKKNKIFKGRVVGKRALTLHRRIPFFYGWVVVGVAFCVSFLSFGMFTYVRGIYLPLFAEAFAVGRFDVTLGWTAEGVVAGCFAPFLGWCLDRFSPRRILLFGLTLVLIGYVLLAVVTELWQFYLVMSICYGMGMTSLGAFTVQRLTVSWFSKRRGLALSLVILGASISGMVMPTVCVWLKDLVGWQNSLIALGVGMGLLLYPMALFLLHDTPASIGLQPDGAESASDGVVKGEEVQAQQVLRSVSFWNIVFVFGVIMCAFGVVTIHAFGHFKEVGLSDYQAAGGLFAMTLCAAAGKPIIGWLTDRLGARISIWISLAMLGAGLLLLAHAVSFSLMTIAMGIFGFGYAGMLPLRSYAVAATVGNRSFGLGNGLMNFAILPLTLGASPFAARVFDLTGSYGMAFQSLVALLVIAAVCPFFIKGGGQQK